MFSIVICSFVIISFDTSANDVMSERKEAKEGIFVVVIVTIHTTC